MSLSINVMPTICEPLIEQPIATCIEQYPHLLELELADLSNSASRHFCQVWDLVIGSVCVCKGSTAVHTRFCWAISPKRLESRCLKSQRNLCASCRNGSFLYVG